MYDRLRTFLEVYRQRSMSKAAAALSLSQPAVSQHVAGLETQFGSSLFTRTPSGVVPTPLADGLARDIAAHLDTLEARVLGRLSRGHDLAGVVHLGAPRELFSVFGGHLIAGFADTDVRVDVHLGGRDQLVHGLEDGSIDLALMASATPGKRYRRDRIGDETLRLYANPELAETARGRRVDADWLSSMPFVAYDQDFSLVRQYFGTVFKEPCTSTPVAIVPDLRAVGAVLSQRRCWSVLPDYLAAALTSSAKLIPLLPEHSVENELSIVASRSALRTERVAFAHELIETIWRSRLSEGG